MGWRAVGLAVAERAEVRGLGVCLQGQLVGVMVMAMQARATRAEGVARVVMTGVA